MFEFPISDTDCRIFYLSLLFIFPHGIFFERSYPSSLSFIVSAIARCSKIFATYSNVSYFLTGISLLPYHCSLEIEYHKEFFKRIKSHPFTKNFLASPTRIVILCVSRYSRIGRAYFREVLRMSLNSATVISFFLLKKSLSALITFS